MSANALQVIDKKSRCISDCLVIFRKLFFGVNDFTHLTLRQADSFPAVNFQKRFLSPGVRVSFGSRLEKLAPFAVCAKIEDEFIPQRMLVWPDFHFGFSHAKMVSCRQYGVNSKS